ncbi:hypothetical protein SYNPS1DRAFT_29212 [Syncephalis pseudoplumigaleata]|uniref:FAD-binding PCMH-type domain-containing protein n=1 Tax=Syncephalis pseudoplumigaleata TaxID=1712513 RepID=A0A4P9YZL2_9FUNG|nr:hypothetical protein SYNPS1DRAFT_29212 [Syncephalis pseudoplumigaleata]|eukprot:RKP25042.1 hypothetical protein SYNPS1DRAFT_29212 [Syncephalis pseudoplumigaleata]
MYRSVRASLRLSGGMFHRRASAARPMLAAYGRGYTSDSSRTVAYTKDKYPGIERSTALNQLSSEDITFFKSILPPTSVITDEDDLSSYNVDWMRKYRGQSAVVLLPKTTEQVAKAPAYCNERSCHIGGNVATNAGGLRLLRYGSLHGTVLGLETVLPDGTVLDNMSTLRKDNTGYDLKQLFIGSEGTLGIITGVSMLTPKRAKSTNVALVGLESFEKVQETFHMAKDMLSEILSAFEFWDHKAAGLVRAHHGVGHKDPLTSQYPFYVLVETQGSDSEHDMAKLNGFLEKLLESSIVDDGVIKSLWSLRELIPEACSKAGAVYKYDVSIPVPKLYTLVEDMRERLAAVGLLGQQVEEVIGYGHVGDGNLHLNITATSYDSKVIY